MLVQNEKKNKKNSIIKKVQISHMHNYRFIISGGGTGGHIYPAIAIANELKNRYPESEILFWWGLKGEWRWRKSLRRVISLKDCGFRNTTELVFQKFSVSF